MGSGMKNILLFLRQWLEENYCLFPDWTGNNQDQFKRSRIQGQVKAGKECEEEKKKDLS